MCSPLLGSQIHRRAVQVLTQHVKGRPQRMSGRLHKIIKNWPLSPLSEKCLHWLNPFLSVQTHHTFRKNRCFLFQKVGRPLLKSTPLSTLDKTLPFTADVFYGQPLICMIRASVSQ